MRFRILGPLEADEDGQGVALGPTKQRALLALLLLNPGRTMPIAGLVDELWGDDPPATARKAIHIHVSGLRRLLPDGTLQTHGSGYRLEVERDDVDLYRFERLRADARLALEQGRHAKTARKLSNALALWRGSALAEFEGEPFARLEGARLEELRMTALEDRIDADLRVGRHSDLVGELETLVARHPLRERLLAQLMVALYRAGRHADALVAFRVRQRFLSDELGIQPSHALRRLELRILRHDRLLEPLVEPPRHPWTGDLSVASTRTGTTRATFTRRLPACSHAPTHWRSPWHQPGRIRRPEIEQAR